MKTSSVVELPAPAAPPDSWTDPQAFYCGDMRAGWENEACDFNAAWCSSVKGGRVGRLIQNFLPAPQQGCSAQDLDTLPTRWCDALHVQCWPASACALQGPLLQALIAAYKGKTQEGCCSSSLKQARSKTTHKDTVSLRHHTNTTHATLHRQHGQLLLFVRHCASPGLVPDQHIVGAAAAAGHRFDLRQHDAQHRDPALLPPPCPGSRAAVRTPWFLAGSTCRADQEGPHPRAPPSPLPAPGSARHIAGARTHILDPCKAGRAQPLPG